MKRALKQQLRRAASGVCEQLELRTLLSTSNALDTLNFGNLASESAHEFEPGVSTSNMPTAGVGTVGASAGQTYRQAIGNESLIFTMAVDPNRQNYLTVRLWGNDEPTSNLDLVGELQFGAADPTSIDEYGETGGNVQFANRFEYDTIPIPISMTTGTTSTQLTLTFSGSGSTLDRPLYSAYTSTDPDFTPASTDPQGTAPTLTGQLPLTTLTSAQLIGTVASPGVLVNQLESLYGSGGYFSSLLAEQAIVLSSTAGTNGTYTWTAPSGAPAEVAGLDLFTNVASWMAANPSATADQWRQQIAGTQAGPGYTAFPDELISALTETYITPPIQDSNGNTLTTLADYHDPALMARIVAAMDGSSYEQDSDGDLIQQGASAQANSAWTGLTSSARTTGEYAGSSAREPTVHGGGDLEGVDTYTLGWSIIQLLNDPVGAPLFETYLSGSYNANLNGTSMMRAYAYERLLFGMVNYYAYGTGGTESQNMFQMLALYSSYVALEKLQALYPNSAYIVSSSTYNSGNYLGTATPLQAAEMVMGLYPDTLRGVVNSQGTNYGLTADGFGEAGGALSTGFDGGGYGQIIPWLAPRIAQLSQWDPTANPTIVSQFAAVADTTINSFDEFLSPLDNATVNSSGVITANVYDFAEETYITYREPKDVNVDADRFNYNAQFLASDPAVGLDDPDALRAAYLNVIYDLTPVTAAGAGNGGDAGSSGSQGGSINYLKDLSAYEDTLRTLVNMNPSTMTPLPAEPGQPDFTWADVQAGAVAFMNNGERVYANLDWRNGTTPSYVARIHDTTGTIERDAEVFMPYNSTTVQSDGNLTSTNLLGAKVLRYGNYLMVLNDGSTAYTTILPPGTSMVEDLISKNMYSPGTTVSVAAGQAAIFWLAAGNTVPALAPGADIGAVGMAGSNTFASSVYTVTGAGADIGGTVDAFRFVSTAASGNATISAQIQSQTAGNNLAQAGVMIRDGTASSAAFAAVLRTPGGGIRFYYRPTAGATAAWVAVPDPLASAWVKLTRSGNNVAAYYSTDGINWTQIGATQSISLQSSAQIGLAVSSNSTTAASTAVFGNVVLNPAVAPTVATAASASATTITGTTANLSVLGADVAGESTLTYTWYTVGTVPDQVSFSANGTNAAKNTMVTFAAAGTYTLGVFITDTGGASTISSVTVTVVQTLTGLSITPTTSLLGNNQTQSFAAPAIDQFGLPMQSSPPVTWSVASGVGTIDQTGLYTAPASGSGAATVRATLGSLTANATVTVFTPTIGIFSGNVNIGTQNSSQSSSYNSSTSTYTVAGSGDVSNNSDTFQFLYIPFTGNGTITTEVTSQTNTNQWAKAGVMFRSSLAANAMNAFVAITPGKGLTFQYRNSINGSENFTNTATITYPYTYWVRLTRSGNAFTGYTSPDGVTWTQIGSTETISMGTQIYVGLFSASVTTSAISTDTFTSVTLVSPTTNTSQIFSSVLPIGNPTIATYTDSLSADTASITDEGGDIWNSADQFEFAYDVITGNTTVVAEVTSQTNTGVWAKAGIMVRASTSPSSAFIDMLITPGKGISEEFRSTNGQNLTPLSGSNSLQTSGAAPVWLALVRSGTSVSGYYDATAPTAAPGVNGSGWTLFHTETITSLGASVDVGLAMTSNNTSESGTAAYADISVTGTANVSPTVATPAAASPNPATGTTTTLTITGADSDGGASNLIYNWSLLGAPPGSVTFSANGTNAASTTVAQFTAAGVYLLEATVQDSGGATAPASLVSVTVNQTFTNIVVSPTTVSVTPGTSPQFSATAFDQFGNPMTVQPTFTWSLTAGVGSINSSSGLYSAPMTGSAAAVQASATVNSVTKNGSGTITITNQAPLIANSAFGATALVVMGASSAVTVPAVDDAGAANLSYSWAPTGPAAVTFTPNGSNAAASTTANFTQAGSYNFTVTITDAGGLTTVGSLTVTVTQILSSVALTPNPITVAGGTSTAFSAVGLDQFSNPLMVQPTFTWSGGGGSIDSSGNFTASQTGGAYTIQAMSNSITGSATVNVVPTIYSTAGNYDVSSSGSIEQIAITSGPTYSINISSLPSLLFSGPAANLTVDFTNGDAVPAGGLNFINGHLLTVIGTSGNDTVTVNGSTVSFNSDVPIAYNNIQSIMVNGGSGADVFTQSAQPGGGAVLAFTPTSYDTLNVNGGNYAIPAPAGGSGFNAYPLATLSIANGASMTVNTAASTERTVLVVNNLSIGSTGRLDLGGNDMIVHSAANGELVAATIAGQVATGRNNGTWNGSEITSSAAAASPITMALAVVLNDMNQAGALSGNPLIGSAQFNNGLSTFDGQTVVDGDVLVKFTSYGDALLNGNVTPLDYAQIDNGFNSGLTGWYNGDFNDDGQINGDDYTLIDNTFNMQGPAMAMAVTPANIVANNQTPATILPASRSRISAQVRVVALIPDATTGGFPNIQTPSSQIDDLLDAWQDKRQKV